jgi:Phosphomevalonate kinase.
MAPANEVTFQPQAVDRSITKHTFSHLFTKAEDEFTANRNYKIVIPGKDNVHEITHIISPEECKAVIDATSTSDEGFTRPTAFPKEARDCERIHTVDKKMSDIMMPRLKPYLPEIVTIDGVRWILSRFTHHWRYVRYYPGGHFSPHYDGVKMSIEPFPCMSIFTVQIYLNGHDEFTGGATRFYPDYKPNRKPSHDIPYGHVSKLLLDLTDSRYTKDGRVYSVEPEAGKALIFNHALNTLHDGESVTQGVKYIMRGDILYTALPEDVHLLPEITPRENVCIDVLKERHWCPVTASKHGTRNHVGEVWYCVCAIDNHGAAVDNDCWHNNDGNREEKALSLDQKRISNDSSQPKIMLLLSGKRAAGKDHIANKIQKAFSFRGFTVCRAALGNINKEEYAKKVGIDVKRLLTDRTFKEQHRVAMINHHTQRNREDPEWCLKQILQQAQNSDILILSDLRTRDDLVWFQNQKIPLVPIRITASMEARGKRGWQPCSVKDTLHTETDLDEYTGWSACWDNSDDTKIGGTLLDNWIDQTVIPRTLNLSDVW